jgi:hypothetical protein
MNTQTQSVLLRRQFRVSQIMQAQAGDTRAALWVCNDLNALLSWAIWQVTRHHSYASYRAALADMKQEARLAILEALPRYNVHQQTWLSYITPCLYQAIYRVWRTQYGCRPGQQRHYRPVLLFSDLTTQYDCTPAETLELALATAALDTDWIERDWITTALTQLRPLHRQAIVAGFRLTAWYHLVDTATTDQWYGLSRQTQHKLQRKALTVLQRIAKGTHLPELYRG